MDAHDDARQPFFPSTPTARAASDGDDTRTAAPPGPVPVVVRSPTDLLACVPLALGFVPERSVVVLSLPPGRGPHARVDVVADLADAPAMAHALVRPAVRHEVTRVAVVVLDELERGRAVAPVLEDAFESAGIEVVALVVADGTHWLSLHRGRWTTVPREYDALSHPFVADAVLRGRVVLASREAVRASVEPDPALVRAVQAAGDVAPVRDAHWVRSMLEQHVREGTTPSVEEVACLVAALGEPDCRDAAWAWAERGEARAHVDLWLRVVRSCPDERVGPAAAVLAFHAWLAGDGALAWCALDRGRRGMWVSLAALVEDLLEAAASPALWTPQQVPGPTSEPPPLADVVDLAAVRRPAHGTPRRGRPPV